MRFLSFLLTVLAAALPVVEAKQSGDTYIVVFEKGLSTPNRIVHDVAKTIKSLGATINWEYSTVVRGFSVSGSESVVEQLKQYNNADYPFVIEKDQGVTVS